MQKLGLLCKFSNPLPHSLSSHFPLICQGCCLLLRGADSERAPGGDTGKQIRGTLPHYGQVWIRKIINISQPSCLHFSDGWADRADVIQGLETAAVGKIRKLLLY